MRIALIFFLIVFGSSSALFAQHTANKKTKKLAYEEISFEDMIRKYLGKEHATASAYEGIYSVSCVIIKRNKRFLSKKEKIKTVERKDNYARVAILKDWPGTSRDFIEVSLSYKEANRYPIVGELHLLSEGRGMIYKHFEPDGSSMSFSFVDQPTEILEGEYSFMDGRKTITYRVSYLKLYPKNSELMVDKF